MQRYTGRPHVDRPDLIEQWAEWHYQQAPKEEGTRVTPRLIEEQAADIVHHLNSLNGAERIWLTSAIMGAITTAIQSASNEALLECRRKHGPPTLLVKKLHPDAILPTRAYGQAAAFDLYARIEEREIHLEPGAYAMVRTGCGFEFPAGFHGKLEARSSHANAGLFTAGGVIDGDYRGEVRALLHNGGQDKFVIHHGDRIAQMLILPVFAGAIEEVEYLTPTERGDKGFGSTGR